MDLFFESNETAYFLIGISKENYGQIFYFDKKIANNFQEFLLNYSKAERYFELLDNDVDRAAKAIETNFASISTMLSISAKTSSWMG
ncbi:hypothetical protein [Neobacillus sp. OS1-33]|uniref:hypothetical protein n=1 Tax=Neobacillus sp. OS1-33 TaxID=3070683 RepID=UPI0027E1CAD5|nr:hypothetical protein [Neobacillus sp. OS1-33]WML26331.1 hypothetical protein RCG22_01400 [Neobacillus sp. OS1-33]